MCNFGAGKVSVPKLHLTTFSNKFTEEFEFNEAYVCSAFFSPTIKKLITSIAHGC